MNFMIMSSKEAPGGLQVQDCSRQPNRFHEESRRDLSSQCGLPDVHLVVDFEDVGWRVGLRSRPGQPQNASSCRGTSKWAHPMQLLRSGRWLRRLQVTQKRWQKPG